MTTKVYIRRLNYCLILVIMMLALFSCISQKKLEYMQNPATGETIYSLHEKEAITIKPNDELYIRVSSFDDVAYNFFSAQTNANNLSFGTDASISMVSYSVDDSGYIYFPILGKIIVKDLTLDGVTNKLKDLLSEYFNQPSVLVKFVNKKITILGEVRQPGSFSYTKDRINIFEALSLAGDITVHGNRKDIYLIRTVNDSIVKSKIDLTKDEILFNKNYYLQTNDIVYVQSRGSVKWGVVSVPISLVLSAITTFLLVYSYIQYN
jgi:polysaccharide export outer membrane protein